MHVKLYRNVVLSFTSSYEFGTVGQPGHADAGKGAGGG